MEKEKAFLPINEYTNQITMWVLQKDLFSSSRCYCWTKVVIYVLILYTTKHLHLVSNKTLALHLLFIWISVSHLQLTHQYKWHLVSLEATWKWSADFTIYIHKDQSLAHICVHSKYLYNALILLKHNIILTVLQENTLENSLFNLEMAFWSYWSKTEMLCKFNSS